MASPHERSASASSESPRPARRLPLTPAIQADPYRPDRATDDPEVRRRCALLLGFAGAPPNTTHKTEP